MLSNKTPLRHRYAMPPLPKERLSCILRTNSKLAKLGIVWYIRHRKDKKFQKATSYPAKCRSGFLFIEHNFKLAQQ